MASKISLVQGSFKNLARLERNHLAGGNFQLIAGMRISSLSRLLLPYDKVPEPGNLHLLSAFQSFFNDFKKLINDYSGLLFCEIEVFVDTID